MGSAPRFAPFAIVSVLLASVITASALSPSSRVASVATTEDPLTAQPDQSKPGDGSGSTTAALGDYTTSTPGTAGMVAEADVPLTRSLKEGMSGDDIRRLQQRLHDLHFEPGTITGKFSHLTTQAVWAFKSLVMRQQQRVTDGVVTQDTWSRMEAAVTVAPRKTNVPNTHVEAYIPEQVLVVFEADIPVLISHVSSGSGQPWKATIELSPGTPDNPGSTPVNEHILGTSITPGGSYKFSWRYTAGDGWRVGKLGKLYKPVYFNQGVAVHGMTDVPNYPASHGCIRLPMGNTDINNQPTGLNPADEFPTLVKNGDPIFVFTATNPSAIGNEAPPYDTPDPTFVTTVPSTTITPTSIPPTTAAPATTTHPTVPKTTRPAPATSSAARVTSNSETTTVTQTATPTGTA